MRVLSAIVVLCGLLLAGCESGHEQAAVPPAANVPGHTPRPLAMPEPSGEKDEQLERFQKDYETAKAAYAKKATSPEAKESLVIATVRLGTATMVSPALESRVKYRGALRLYREALKLDPKNEEALSNKKRIEDIYRDLGREIPE